MPLRLTVKVKPGSRLPGISETAGIITVAVRERAVDGRANAAVLASIAAWLGIAAGRITIEQGAGSRYKRLMVDDLSEGAFEAAVVRLRAGD